MPKTCVKPFWKNIKVVLWKKPLQKTPNIRKIGPFWKSATRKGYNPCKGYSLYIMDILGQKLKMPKTCKNPFYKNITVVLCKKPLKKSPNNEEWDNFENQPSCKGYSPWEGYSLCKIVSLGQKLKMPKTCVKPFWKNIKVVLWKKPLQKTPNIRKIGPFWKSAISQRL